MTDQRNEPKSFSEAQQLVNEHNAVNDQIAALYQQISDEIKEAHMAAFWRKFHEMAVLEVKRDALQQLADSYQLQPGEALEFRGAQRKHWGQGALASNGFETIEPSA